MLSGWGQAEKTALTKAEQAQRGRRLKASLITVSLASYIPEDSTHLHLFLHFIVLFIEKYMSV